MPSDTSVLQGTKLYSQQRTHMTYKAKNNCHLALAFLQRFCCCFSQILAYNIELLITSSLHIVLPGETPNLEARTYFFQDYGQLQLHDFCMEIVDLVFLL